MWGRIRVGILVGSWVASVGSLASAGGGKGPVAGAVAPGALAGGALDKPAFTAAPGELLALGKAAPTGDWSMVVLRDQRDVSYDDKGRATVRVRRVYVVQTPDGDDGDDGIHAEWHASYQDRPVVRARVIDPAGTTVELDPALITEMPAVQRPPNAVSELRYLGGSLPALKSGAVVEEEITTTDREPPIAGSVDISRIGNFVPTSSTVISYSAPASARLHHVERNLPAGARVRHQLAHGRETWVHEIPALPVRTTYEVDVPVDVVVAPYVGVGTAASWEAAARAYRKLIDQRIAEGPFDLPAELPRTASIEALGAIVAWVHRHVHDSVAYGVIQTPATPAETVQRAAGDSSDKATLLVALLRQAGIRADVALLEIGWMHQPDPELPGLGAFDHALVRARIATGDIWLDPSEELVRPGQLPEQAQGRRVLVIADDTKLLAMTPMATAADNSIRDVRTFTAAEYGPSQLTQVVRYSGVFEAEHRRWSRSGRGDLPKRQHASRTESLFGGTLERVASSNADDLTNPFEVTLAVKGSNRVFTEPEEIDVYLFPGDTVEQLPWQATRQVETPRSHDFAWSRPQVYEIENRIIVPPGFTLPAAAPERVRPLGPATLTENQRLEGQTLIVTFRLDTGKLRLTPAELAKLQAALKELGDERVHIKLDHTGFALGYAGKPREAIAECERLIALHPKEGLHHSQLSTALLRAGAGEAARREARKAVAMAPGDVHPLVVLGWTLSHDTLGRPYTYDWDRAGAIAALQQARKLDPKHLGAAVSLAHALQRDAAGRLYDGADLPGAVEAWRAALALDKTDENALALAQLLVWSGQFAEAEKVARAAGAGEERDKWIVVAVAGGDGAKRASKVAGELRSGDSRNQLLETAGRTMLWLQRYDLARELLTESGAMARLPGATAAMLNKLKKYPDIKSGTADPRSVVYDMLASLLDPLRKTSVFWDAELERALHRQAQRFIHPAPGNTTARWSGDVLQSLTSVEIEGDAGVWRGAVDHEGRRYQVYLVLDRGAVKVIGATDALEAVGRYILRGGDAKAQARARKLLDWIRADGDKATWGDMVAFKRMWGQGMPTTRDAIMLAAAVLAGASDPDRVIPVGSQCASTLPDAELTCHELLFLAYRARGRWSEAVTRSEAILAQRPDSMVARAGIHAWALSRAGRFDDADRFLDEVLAKDPDHHGARLARFEVAALRGASAEITRRADAVVNHPAATPGDLNYVAWYWLAQGGDLSGALELARKAVDKAPEAGSINTLAAIEAERGDLGRAIEDNRKAMALRNTPEPTDGDWYVVGRIDEQLGLTADAAAAYKRVTKPSYDAWLAVYTLAQHRLAPMVKGH